MNDMLAIAAFALGFTSAGAMLCLYQAWHRRDIAWLWLGLLFVSTASFVGFGHTFFDLFKV